MLGVVRAKKGRHGVEERCCDSSSRRTSRFAVSVSFRFFCEIVVCFVDRYFCVYDRFSEVLGIPNDCNCFETATV